MSMSDIQYNSYTKVLSISTEQRVHADCTVEACLVELIQLACPMHEAIM